MDWPTLAHEWSLFTAALCKNILLKVLACTPLALTLLINRTETDWRSRFLIQLQPCRKRAGLQTVVQSFCPMSFCCTESAQRRIWRTHIFQRLFTQCWLKCLYIAALRPMSTQAKCNFPPVVWFVCENTWEKSLKRECSVTYIFLVYCKCKLYKNNWVPCNWLHDYQLQMLELNTTFGTWIRFAGDWSSPGILLLLYNH